MFMSNNCSLTTHCNYQLKHAKIHTQLWLVKFLKYTNETDQRKAKHKFTQSVCFHCYFFTDLVIFNVLSTPTAQDKHILPL